MSDEYDCVLNGCGEDVPCDADCKCECTHCQRNRPTYEEEEEEGEEGDQCEECYSKAATKCEMCGNSLCHYHTRGKDKESPDLCQGCFGKEEENAVDGDGFVICSKCGKGGGKCDGDCEESK